MRQEVQTRLTIMSVAVALAVAVYGCGGGSGGDGGTGTASVPGTSASDTAIDARAAALVAQMTTEEKIAFVRGADVCGYGKQSELSGAGYIKGIPRLGIPDLNMTDGGAGVGDCSIPSRAKANPYATSLPAPVALASSWDPQLSYDYGALIGTQARAQGFNVLLGGSVGLTRDPRLGRAFEYMGEDPVLSAAMVTPKIRGTQDQKVLMSLKHYAGNQQETSRTMSNSIIAERPLRELYLRHFEWAVRDSSPATVMCSYNQVNGEYVCENKTLLDILKNEWGFKGWVQSDWGANHSTVKSANAGLDEEEMGSYYTTALKQAVTVDGTVTMARLDNMVHRKLREMIAKGVMDNPPVKAPIDFAAGDAMAQKVLTQSAVLLKNTSNLLPLAKSGTAKIAVIGLHADQGVLTGGGSSEIPTRGGIVNVTPATCPALNAGAGNWCEKWIKDSPLAAIKAKVPSATVTFNDGSDIASATAAAAAADVVIVYAHQWATEGADVGTGLTKLGDDLGSNGLNLRGNQDALIAAVAAAKPGKTVVVLQNGNPVVMPWIDQVGAVLEAWFPGEKGAEAIADLLFGDANPSGKLPVTFPKNLADFATGSAKLPASTGGKVVDVNYSEGMLIGYRWYDTKGIEPLFPFGHGLSYTTFAYSGISVANDYSSVSFTLSNTGTVKGSEVAQVYAELPASVGDAKQRLVGFQKVELAPGTSQKVTIAIPRERLMYWNTAASRWEFANDVYTFKVGSSSRDVRLSAAW